jgi:dephospho-CoA kinase
MMVQSSGTLLVGLTGAIGAGKSTVAELLSKRGLPVIDADVLGRDVVETSAPVKRRLREEFGPSVFAADGAVDRDALARAAFASEEAAARLNAIVHPELWERVKRELAVRKNADVVVIDAALIVEWGPALPVDVVVVVDAPEGTRKERSRGKYGDEDFYARQSRQLDERRKLAAADVVVDNAGTPAELEGKADLLYELLMDMARGKKPESTPVVI